MSILSDMHKQTHWVKVVPNAEPNADGEWQTVFINPSYSNNYDYINSLLAKGLHVVQVRKSKPT